MATNKKASSPAAKVAKAPAKKPAKVAKAPAKKPAKAPAKKPTPTSDPKLRATDKKPQGWRVPLDDLHHATPYAVEERGDTVWLLGHTALVVTRVAEASPWKVALPPIDFARAHAATATLFYAFVEEADEVWAIDVEARRVWGATLPASSWRPELFVCAGVLVAQRGGLLAAFDADTGAPLWSRTLASDDAQIVAAASGEGLLLHFVTDALLLRLDWRTGETQLSRAGLESGWFVGDAGEGRVLLGRDGELVLVEAREGGATLWKATAVEPACALDGRGRVLAFRDVTRRGSKTESKLAALDLRTGVAVWTTQVNAFPHPPKVVGDRAFLARGGKVLALRLDDGAPSTLAPAQALLGTGVGRLYVWGSASSRTDVLALDSLG